MRSLTAWHYGKMALAERTFVDVAIVPAAPPELSIRQLALPIVSAAASIPTLAAPWVHPEHVWTDLTPAARQQVEQIFRRIFLEVACDADRG